MGRIYVSVMPDSMELTVKSMIHVDHHRVLTVALVFQRQTFRFGNVFVSDCTLVSIL